MPNKRKKKKKKEKKTMYGYPIDWYYELEDPEYKSFHKKNTKGKWIKRKDMGYGFNKAGKIKITIDGKTFDLPGLHTQKPWSPLILEGNKTIETRSYNTIPIGVPIAVLET